MSTSELSDAVAEIDNLISDLDAFELKWAGGNGSVPQGAFQEHLDRWVELVVECVRQRVSDKEAGEARRKLSGIWYMWSSPDDPDEQHFAYDSSSARGYLEALKGARAKYPHLLQSLEAISPPRAEAVVPSRLEVPASLRLTPGQTQALATLERHRYVLKTFDVIVTTLGMFVESVTQIGYLLLVLAWAIRWVVLWLWRFPVAAWRWARDETNATTWIVIGVLIALATFAVAVLAYLDRPQGAAP